ncbi:helix-turn-helix domain-containing protein [Aeoliella mucimassa]|uniref:Helix-turn-helix domain protein n=1 Tax=Aeoliella mucimassa TaxID=2527972 RepID=A0A518AM53_9BACT|nr:helix-turn-helix domain-containing protein [Aeoliella mucimassa]QDU55788.1 Helix-turn-helix domain protein [Aeoliella mucimassa]
MATIAHEYLTAQETADLLRISARHLRTLTKSGKVPSIKVAERSYRYPKAELLESLKPQRGAES